MKEKIVVVGGVAGGMSFATRYRRLNQTDEIIILEKGPYVSFANCGLPYHLSGEINDRDDLLVVKEEVLKQRFDLDIRVNHEVIDVNHHLKKVKVKHENQYLEIEYDKLILSPGAKASIPMIEGIESIPYFTLRNLPDLDKIIAYIDKENPMHVGIIGGGFIGIETAEALSKKGLKVSVIDTQQILSFLDLEMAVFAKDTLEKHEIKVFEQALIHRVSEGYLHLKENQKIKVDFLVVAAGVKPNLDFLKNIEFKKNHQGALLVDEMYQTSIPDIYAVGDAIATKHMISTTDEMSLLASPANRAGRQLADNLNGIKNMNKGHISTAIIRIFDQVFAATGLNESKLKGKAYQVMHLLGNDHASYYPEATSIHLKVLFDPVTEKILGAQAFGKHGIDKRIDVLATIIKAGMNITDLQNLELSYAPMFGTAKDIINMVGYVSSNMILGITRRIDYKDLDNYIKQGVTLLDVRTNKERAQGFIKDSMHIEINHLRASFHKIPKDKPVILYCESGVRSYQGELFLRSQGYDTYNLDGSFAIYRGIYKERIVKS